MRRPKSRTRIYEGRKVSLRVDSYELGEAEHQVEVVEHRGAAVVLPITGDSKIVMVRQYRYPVGQYLLELPAGTLERGEDPETCARRELEEETGLRPRELRLLGSFYASPGYSTELLHAYLATGLVEGRPRREAYEDIGVVEVPESCVHGLIAGGYIRDAKTLAALALYYLGGKRNYRPGGIF